MVLILKLTLRVLFFATFLKRMFAFRCSAYTAE